MKRLILAVLALLLVAVSAGPALAHATLKQATPESGAVLEQAPARVELIFTEEVEAEFGAISVFDHTGNRVDQGDSARDPGDVTRVHATLKPLSDGLYTVTYRVISTDGHPITGSYGFTVGKGTAGAKYYQPELPDPGGQPPLSVLAGYWLAVGGLMLLFGLGLTQRLVLRGGAPAGWFWASAGAALLGTLVYLVGRTAQAAGIGFGEALSPALLGRMLLTATGRAVLARLVLLVSTLSPLLARRWWFAAGVGALGLLTVSLGGHAVALQRPALGVGLDWLHLLAAGAWTGGLVQLVFVARGREPAELGAMVRRFSPVAAVSVVVLIGTGIYPVLLHVPSVKALQETAYGQTLQVKLLLILPLLALGAVNLLWIGPRLRRGMAMAGWLRRLAGAEMAVMAAVLAAAVLLTNLPPARVALPPARLDVGAHLEHHEMLVRMEPLAPGYRTADITVGSHDGEVTAETKVTLELVMLEHPMGKNVNVGKFLGNGLFRFEHVLIGMPGRWEFKVTVEMPGHPAESFTFEEVVPAEIQ